MHVILFYSAEFRDFFLSPSCNRKKIRVCVYRRYKKETERFAFVFYTVCVVACVRSGSFFILAKVSIG